MTRDELEFQISQYLDGTLAEPEQSALEARLAVDSEARALLDAYRRLDVALKAAPLPAVDWDRFADQVCAAVSEQQEETARSYRIGSFRTMAGLAVAASVIVGIGVGIRMLQRPGPGQPTGPIAIDPGATRAATEIVIVDARPAAPVASASPVEVIAVGPSRTLQDRPGFAGYHDDVVTRRSQGLIARSGQPVHDATFLP